jgi:hypothetical protein
VRNLKLCILLFGLFVTLGLRAQNANAQFIMHNAQSIDTIAPINSMVSIDAINSIDSIKIYTSNIKYHAKQQKNVILAEN